MRRILTKNLQNSQCASRDLNPVLSKIEAALTPLDRSVSDNSRWSLPTRPHILFHTAVFNDAKIDSLAGKLVQENFYSK
jgi:hypothetical protein